MNKNLPFEYDNLWADWPGERLKVAECLEQVDISPIQESLAKGCPVEAWPYAMPTVVNPYVVVLGMSPGVSPASGDSDYNLRPTYELPTVGAPHPRWYYKDSRGYWDKVRYLCVRLLKAIDPDFQDPQAFALSGHMNLSTGASGKASEVTVRLDLASWVATVISKGLKPRYVIGVGLTSALKEGDVQAALSNLGTGPVDFTKPDRVRPFRGHQRTNLSYREWDFTRPDGGMLTFVSWPQHPGRAPFTNREIWEESVSEYCRTISGSPTGATLFQNRISSDDTTIQEVKNMKEMISSQHTFAAIKSEFNSASDTNFREFKNRYRINPESKIELTGMPRNQVLRWKHGDRWQIFGEFENGQTVKEFYQSAKQVTRRAERDHDMFIALHKGFVRLVPKDERVEA